MKAHCFYCFILTVFLFDAGNASTEVSRQVKRMVERAVCRTVFGVPPELLPPPSRWNPLQDDYYVRKILSEINSVPSFILAIYIGKIQNLTLRDAMILTVLERRSGQLGAGEVVSLLSYTKDPAVQLRGIHLFVISAKDAPIGFLLEDAKEFAKIKRSTFLGHRIQATYHKASFQDWFYVELLKQRYETMNGDTVEEIMKQIQDFNIGVQMEIKYPYVSASEMAASVDQTLKRDLSSSRVRSAYGVSVESSMQALTENPMQLTLDEIVLHIETVYSATKVTDSGQNQIDLVIAKYFAVHNDDITTSQISRLFSRFRGSTAAIQTINGPSTTQRLTPDQIRIILNSIRSHEHDPELKDLFVKNILDDDNQVKSLSVSLLIVLMSHLKKVELELVERCISLLGKNITILEISDLLHSVTVENPAHQFNKINYIRNLSTSLAVYGRSIPDLVYLIQSHVRTIAENDDLLDDLLESCIDEIQSNDIYAVIEAYQNSDRLNSSLDRFLATQSNRLDKSQYIDLIERFKAQSELQQEQKYQSSLRLATDLTNDPSVRVENFLAFLELSFPHPTANDPISVKWQKYHDHLIAEFIKKQRFRLTITQVADAVSALRNADLKNSILGLQ